MMVIWCSELYMYGRTSSAPSTPRWKSLWLSQARAPPELPAPAIQVQVVASDNTPWLERDAHKNEHLLNVTVPRRPSRPISWNFLPTHQTFRLKHLKSSPLIFCHGQQRWVPSLQNAYSRTTELRLAAAVLRVPSLRHKRWLV